ncbi:MAG: DUF3120 domain-containing protein [Cyanosarcina radialis HA8281-LM2]|nr:DUF3120 domain-containing protein [Cyanosarcina radialis HA8281-LM2]
MAWQVFAAAAFLVSVPVFFQAPLVRYLPWFSLAMTPGWFGLGWTLIKRPSTKLWGDLLLGFSWSWLAGSIYWGWYRWEPSIHLPVEAIGLPFALWFLFRASRGAEGETRGEFLTPHPTLHTPRFLQHFFLKGKVGNLFYLGSLLGTAITDLYFYLTGSIPYWRQLMRVEPAMATPILQSAIAHIRTPWGLAWAVVLIDLLLAIAFLALQTKKLHWWAFAGAVLSTILVDSLFVVAAFFL